MGTKAELFGQQYGNSAQIGLSLLRKYKVERCLNIYLRSFEAIDVIHPAEELEPGGCCGFSARHLGVIVS